METLVIVRRKPNWTAAELEMLAQAVSENIGTLRAKFSMGLTNDIKNKCWVRITERYG
jgi:hypothetical protein